MPGGKWNTDRKALSRPKPEGWMDPPITKEPPAKAKKVKRKIMKWRTIQKILMEKVIAKMKLSHSKW